MPADLLVPHRSLGFEYPKEPPHGGVGGGVGNRILDLGCCRASAAIDDVHDLALASAVTDIHNARN